MSHLSPVRSPRIPHHHHHHDAASGRATSSAGSEPSASTDVFEPTSARRAGHPAADEVTTVTGYQNGRAFPLRVSSVGDGQYLRLDAAERYRAMKAAAARDGVNLEGVSGYRTWREQAVLRARYGPRRAARPGFSNHQRGLSLDIAVSGRPKVQGWLARNAAKFGFHRDTWEAWHFTYAPPLSR